MVQKFIAWTVYFLQGDIRHPDFWFWCLNPFLGAQKKHQPQAHGLKPVLASGPPGARTLDTLIKSQVLYQLS